MSKKINDYLVLDWETGGIPKWEDKKESPVCEVACIGINGRTLEEILRYDNMIKPYDLSLPYEEGAWKANGLSMEEVKLKGIQLSQVVEDICIVATETNVEQSKIARPILVGHNITFDIPLLQKVFQRAKKDLSQYLSGFYDCFGNFQIHYYDTMHLSKSTYGNSQDKTIKFNLEESCKRDGSELTDGHRALNDVIATSSLFRTYIARLRSRGGSKGEDGSGQVRKLFQI